MRKELQQVQVPDADGARDRAWRVVAAAFEVREPALRDRRRWPLAVALAAALLVAATTRHARSRALSASGTCIC